MPDPDDPDGRRRVGRRRIAVHELLDRLFLASGKLASRDDAASVLAVDDVVGTLERMGPPFGFEAPQWRHLVGRSVVLRDALAAARGRGLPRRRRAAGRRRRRPRLLRTYV